MNELNNKCLPNSYILIVNRHTKLISSNLSELKYYIVSNHGNISVIFYPCSLKRIAQAGDEIEIGIRSKFE